MPLLSATAQLLSNNTLISGVIEEIIELDDMFALLPFVQVNSKAYVYHREDYANAQNNINQGTGVPGFLNAGTDTVNEGAAPFVEIIAKLRILAGDVDVDNFMAETMDDSNDQVAIQIAKKAKAVGRLFHQTAIVGDATGTPTQFDGFSKMIANGNTGQQILAATGGVTTNGGPLTLAALDQLLDAVPLGADAIVMRRGTIRAFRQLLRAAGGTHAAEFMLPAFGRPMLTHNGVPVIINDFIPGNVVTGTSNTTCSVYAARFNEADGVHGLYGGETAGLRVDDVGIVQNKDSRRYRVKWYCGLALKSTQSLAELTGVTNV